MISFILAKHIVWQKDYMNIKIDYPRIPQSMMVSGAWPTLMFVIREKTLWLKKDF